MSLSFDDNTGGLPITRYVVTDSSTRFNPESSYYQTMERTNEVSTDHDVLPRW